MSSGPAPTRAELLDLWLRHLDGEVLTPEEQQALLRGWEADPALLELCAADAAFDGMLASRPGDAAADRAFAAGVATVLRSERDGADFARRVQRRLRPRRRTARGPWAAPVWVGLAAAAMLLLGGTWLATRPPSAATLPTLAQTADLPITAGRPLAVGALIGPAAATLAWADGTTAEVRAGSRVEVLAADHGKRLALHVGSVTVGAAHQPAGRPLVITTPEGRATVVGTRFVLDSAAGTARLAVSEGTVRLERPDGSMPVAVGAGTRALADGAGVRLMPAAAWAWSAADKLAPAPTLGHRGTAPDGRPCAVAAADPAVPKVVAVTWKVPAQAPGLFTLDRRLALTCDLWLGPQVRWAGVYVQDPAPRAPDGRLHHGQHALPLDGRGGWVRVRVPLAGLEWGRADELCEDGDRIGILTLQAQFPPGAELYLDRLEIAPEE